VDEAPLAERLHTESRELEETHDVEAPRKLTYKPLAIGLGVMEGLG
jgi:hypothetical protein